MNEYQQQGYKNHAEKIEHEMREMGYMSSDIVVVAYFLLKNNIDKAEGQINVENKLQEMMQRAEKLLKE
ncbi:hypothetical protein P7D15_01380 [Bacillus cereus]|uniref:hypothetical protein n=1 Tax=Bacillus cereus group TaxID=86661 RepID=UPI0024076B41|nr:hypothetical protein [Bacillus cereus]MDF9599066.1 hypothetical protein [Bacillus cereus]MDG1589399.1 hypothetical protein [Bacillus cereus]HDR7922292.1 hypothetical protein [Bacillus paranthracis]